MLWDPLNQVALRHGFEDWQHQELPISRNRIPELIEF
jgi:hypothetical protein